ncbi:hypothetical protein DTO027B5_3713 [Paecilomyces variotii]|nr:hypothetical protein DTO032I3_1334 [Paecilomyces variotii]KAJ9223963.1 hypothetical protein DTO169C6_3583 [Paecilomyces variotii]KAJ9279927.1 hypothetical protein DTO021D3_3155 [Paecilomyces variotii]KAJ9288991.1 hypothetical protein DTO021C3_3516 [Paecilomyces variotii]KAJ9326072.1 hypothetical protein DTO027B3_3048 [Paecilomyces variotii]
MKFSLLSLAAIVPLAAAHFKLEYPPSRGFDEDKMPEFPCGGFPQSSNRTKLSLSADSIPVALILGHSQTAAEVLLALGNDPGDNYNITLAHTFGITGLGAFCLPSVSLKGVPLTDGLNATVQVVTDGDNGGGLYACADVTFTSAVTSDDVSPTVCKNNTGVTATPFSGAAAARNANESTADGQAQSSSGSSSSSSSASGTAATATSKGAAAPLETAAWGMMGAALIGGLAVL